VRLRSTPQRKQTIGESVIQTENFNQLEEALNLGLVCEAVTLCELGEKGAHTEKKPLCLWAGLALLQG